MRKYLIVLLLPFLFSACEKAFFEEAGSSQSPKQNFEYLWDQCNRKYAFLEYKKLDWSATKSKYASRISEDMGNEQLFSVLGSMLNELRDGHVNLISSFNISRFDVSLLGPTGIDERLIRENYLPTDYFITGPFIHDFVKGHPDIGYIRLASFSGTITHNQLNFMLNRYKNTRGLIFDLRSNGGGVVKDIFTILCHFVDHKTLLYRSSIKNGPGKNDFSAAEDCYVEPMGTLYLNKIAVLTDRGTYSAGSFTSTATKAIDHIILVGDTTGGGMGMPNGGQLPNGWTYRFSITRTLDVSGNNWENGVPPEIPIRFDPNQALSGVDNILERALLEF